MKVENTKDGLINLLDKCEADYTSVPVENGTLFTIRDNKENAYYVLARDIGFDMWSGSFTPERVIAATLGIIDVDLCPICDTEVVEYD